MIIRVGQAVERDTPGRIREVRLDSGEKASTRRIIGLGQAGSSSGAIERRVRDG